MEDKQALLMLGEIMGMLKERANTEREFRERLTRIEEGMTNRLNGHAARINALEVNFARESVKRGAIGGAGAGAAIAAAVEVARKLLGH